MTSITSTVKFQSTPPSREATRSCDDHRWSIHISIHASLTGGDYCYGGYDHSYHISIHASLTGGDYILRRHMSQINYFNPRLPHGRRRHIVQMQHQAERFQSTPPSREATSTMTSITSTVKFQSTPPSREATYVNLEVEEVDTISIHASLTGGDIRELRADLIESLFQSTPPSREATWLHSSNPLTMKDFNPRLPHGRRRIPERV